MLINGVDFTLRNNEGFTAIEKGLEGRDNSFNVNCFSKICSSPIPDKTKIEILRSITIHPNFNPNSEKLIELLGESPLSKTIKLKLFPISEILVNRGARYILPNYGLPKLIFQSNKINFINSFVDTICTFKIICLSNCELHSIPQVIIDKLLKLDRNSSTKEKKVLDISNNYIHSIPAVLSSLSILSNVKIDGNPLSLIPEYARSSWLKVQSYLKGLDKRAENWARYKVSKNLNLMQ